MPTICYTPFLMVHSQNLILYPRSLTPPKQSFFLLGPRGSGKTSWVQQQFPTNYTIDLLEEARYQAFLKNPSLFAQELETLSTQQWVFVDEIQRLPNLLNEVHRFIERKKLKFILTGSSSRKLKRAGVNLLAGRALLKQMYPFLPEELGSDFSIQKLLLRGSLPVVWMSESFEETLQTYVVLYLKEEIQAEALTRNLGGFARFLEIAGLFHGQKMQESNIAREAGVARTTVQGFLEILVDTLLAFKLTAFSSRLRVREKKHPKLYWVDPGLVRVVRGEREIDAQNLGCLFEGWVAQTLRAYRDYTKVFDEFYYWSPAESQTEVDFLLKRGKKYWAVEVKATENLRPEHFKGLKAIAELPGLERQALVYLGKKPLKIEGVDIVPAAHLRQWLFR